MPVPEPARAGAPAAPSRTLILDAAERLFATRGYDGTSTSRIAEQAGVTRTLIFHYFPTKERILATLLRERGAYQVLDGIGPPPAGTDLAAALADLAARVRARLDSSRWLVQIMLREQSGQPLTRDLFTGFLAQLDGLVRATITTALPPDAGGTSAPAARIDAVTRMFAAVLLRDTALEPGPDGAARAPDTSREKGGRGHGAGDGGSVAQACALALGARP